MIWQPRQPKKSADPKKLYNLSNVELEQFASLREIIGQTKANKQARDITINNQKFDQEDIEKAKRQAKKDGKIYSREDLEKLAELIKKRRQRDTAVSILRGISIRMPLLLFGAKLDSEDQNITLDRFVELVDDKSWAEFMPLGVTKDRFAEYKKYYDEDIFSAAGRQIRQLALAADKMPVLQRIQHIAQIFDSFRNPDKETVLTPWRVVNMYLSDTVGGWCFVEAFHEPSLQSTAEPRFVDRGIVSQRLFENSNVRILEINSKSGLYPLYMAYSVFRHRLRVLVNSKRGLFKKATIDDEHHVWTEVLKENIFVICKTEMARSITQRTLAGFTGAEVNTHVYDALLSEIMRNKSDFVEVNPTKVREYKDGDKFDSTTEIKLFTNGKAGKSGRAKWYVVNRSVITTGVEYLDKWKVVVSSANAGGQKRSNQIQILDNHSAFGRSRVALKTFETEREARNFFAYAKSKFIRFAFLMTDESLTSLAKLVPDIQDYKDDNGIIDFSKDIDEQLFSLFDIPEMQQKHIEAILSSKKE